MILYHRTDHADAIHREGFKDAEGRYLTAEIHRGVWVSDIPLDINEGARGDDLFVIEIPESVLADYEWVEEFKGYREFLIPAALLNGYPRRLLAPDSEL
jgi:hypothetical protein